MMIRRIAVAIALVSSACTDPFEATSARTYKSLATGGEHTCAVATDGSAYCWGRGVDGELGTGSKASSTTPQRVTGSVVFDQITAGENHTCALAVGGAAYCWGWNVFYQRGNPTDPVDDAPVAVTTNVRFRAISAGQHHTCAISLDSLAYCWGYNRYGQGGDGTTGTIVTPKAVQGGIKFTQISSGGLHTCGLSGTQIYCWGNNEYGQLGTSSSAIFNAVAEPVRSAVGFTQVDAGTTHTCAVSTNTQLYCWGSNEFGELGNSGVFKPGLPGANTPQLLFSLFNQGLRIYAGDRHSCAVGLDGEGRCWGRGEFGQVGNGSSRDQYVAQPLTLFAARIQVTSFALGGRKHACALIDQSAYCWGTGDAGQLGVSGTRYAPMPARVGD